MAKKSEKEQTSALDEVRRHVRSRLVLALENLDLQSHGASSRSTSLNVVSVVAVLAGLTSTATRAAAGTNSRRSPSCFAANSE